MTFVPSIVHRPPYDKYSSTALALLSIDDFRALPELNCDLSNIDIVALIHPLSE